MKYIVLGFEKPGKQQINPHQTINYASSSQPLSIAVLTWLPMRFSTLKRMIVNVCHPLGEQRRHFINTCQINEW